MQKNEIGYSFTLYTKVNSDWIKESNGRPETMKCLEENIDQCLDIGLGDDLFNLTTKTKAEIKASETISN